MPACSLVRQKGPIDRLIVPQVPNIPSIRLDRLNKAEVPASSNVEWWNLRGFQAIVATR
jgi:hypothetical protein